MDFILNVSFLIPNELEKDFIIWQQESIILKDFKSYRLIAKQESGCTYCSLSVFKNISEVQSVSSTLESQLNESLRSEFEGKIHLFMSVLQSI